MKRKTVDFKFNERTGRNNFCIRSDDAWKQIPTRFNYDLADGEKPAFLEEQNPFTICSKVEVLERKGFVLTDKAREQKKLLNSYIKTEFDLILSDLERKALRKKLEEIKGKISLKERVESYD